MSTYSAHCKTCGYFIPDKRKATQGLYMLCFGFDFCCGKCKEEYELAHPVLRGSNWKVFCLIIGGSLVVSLFSPDKDAVAKPSSDGQQMENITTPAPNLVVSNFQQPSTPEVNAVTVQQWTNFEGKTISANMEGMDMFSVHLRLKDGSTTHYPLSKLSVESRVVALERIGLTGVHIMAFGKVINVPHSDTLNVRTAASASSMIVATLKWDDEFVPVIGKPSLNDQDKWVPILVSTNDGLTKGWVLGSYLSPMK